MSARLQLVHHPQRPTADLLAEWGTYMTAYGCTPATVRGRVQCIESLWRHAGVDDVLDLTRNHVVAWLGRPVKPWTRKTYFNAVVGWSKWLVEFGHDPDNDLTRGIPRPKRPLPAARPIDDTIVVRLLDLRLPLEAHAWVRLALFSALRVHEIAKLRAEDIDFDNGWLLVTGKGGHTRSVPLHPEIVKLADQMPATSWWFPSRVGPGHVHPLQVGKTIKNALRLAGSDGTAHMLRDTAATQLQRKAKDIRLTQSLLRHADLSTTMKYAAVADEQLQTAVRSLSWTEPPRLPRDLSGISDAQLRDLASQLLTALAERQEAKPA